MSAAKHTPGKTCNACEGFCLVPKRKSSAELLREAEKKNDALTARNYQHEQLIARLTQALELAAPHANREALKAINSLGGLSDAAAERVQRMPEFKRLLAEAKFVREALAAAKEGH